MKITGKIKKRAGLVVLLLAGLLLFAGCSDSGTAGGGDGNGATPRDANFDALYETLSVASSNIENPTVALFSFQGPFYLSVFALYIDAWDGSSSYTYGAVTVTVSESNGIWTWTYTDNDTGEYMEYVIEETGSGWVFSWTVDGLLYASGSMSSDGYTSQVDIFDVETPDPDDKTVSYSSVPSSGAYDLEVVSSYYETGTELFKIVIRTNYDGASGEWSYTDLVDSNNNASGSWSPGP